MISLISALLEPFPGSKKKNQDGFFWISVSVQSVCAVTGSEKEDREKYRCNRGLREFGDREREKGNLVRAWWRGWGILRGRGFPRPRKLMSMEYKREREKD